MRSTAKVANLATLDELASKLDANERRIELGLRSRWNASRREQGLVLKAYQDLYKPLRLWKKFLRRLACSPHCVPDSLQMPAAVSDLPAVVIEAAKSRGFDLAEYKYRSAVAAIKRQLTDIEPDEEQAAQIISNVIPFRAPTGSIDEGPVQSSAATKTECSLEDFADRTVKSFEDRYRGASQRVRDAEVQYVFELVNATLRASITNLRQYRRPAPSHKAVPPKRACGMSLDGSGISWTEGTLNSLYGCRERSVGCRLCYAVDRVHRFSRNLEKVNADGRFNGLVKEGVKEERRCFTGALLFDAAHLYAVLGDRKPKRIFVNEFSDLFYESLPMALIIEHFKVFKVAHWHTYQVLTKRDKRLADVNDAVLATFGEWPTNVWMGVTVCSSAKREMKRIDQLGATGASLKWISFEPWISDVNRPLSESVPGLQELLRKNRISWVVVGGESGAKDETNMMTLEDARYLMSESKAAGCRVHFKQLGTALAIQLGVYSTEGDHRAKGGFPEQWPADLNVREYPDFVSNSCSAPVSFKPAYAVDFWQHF